MSRALVTAPNTVAALFLAALRLATTAGAAPTSGAPPSLEEAHEALTRCTAAQEGGAHPDRHAAALQGISLRHLLNHTAGLPRDAAQGAEWLAESLAMPRVGRPGERYAYSNLGYALAEDLIESAVRGTTSAETPSPSVSATEIGLVDDVAGDEERVVGVERVENGEASLGVLPSASTAQSE